MFKARVVLLLLLCLGVAIGWVIAVARPSTVRAMAKPHHDHSHPSFEQPKSPLTPTAARSDLGNLKAGVMVRRSFSLKNVSDSPVEVTNVDVSCTCTWARASSTKVAPGKSTTVTLAYLPPFDLRGTYQDAKQAFVYVNGFSQPAVVLEVIATVKCPIMAQPPRILLGRVTSGTSISRRSVIYLDSRSNLFVETARTSLPQSVSAKLTPPVSAREGFRTQLLEVILRPDCPVGKIAGTIALRTSTGQVLKIPVLGRIEGLYGADPEAVYFGHVRRGDSNSLTFDIVRRKGPSPRIQLVQSSNPHVIAKRVSDTGKVTVRLADSTPGGEVQGKISVRLDGGSSVTVPVYAYVE